MLCTKRAMRLVLPTPNAPIMHTFFCNIICFRSLRGMLLGDPVPQDSSPHPGAPDYDHQLPKQPEASRECPSLVMLSPLLRHAFDSGAHSHLLCPYDPYDRRPRSAVSGHSPLASARASESGPRLLPALRTALSEVVTN